jgi:hypothetical protein
VKPAADQYAVYFHCQTNLVETFRELYPELRFEGNRAILLDAREKPPEAALRHCVALALTSFAQAEAGEREVAPHATSAASSGRSPRCACKRLTISAWGRARLNR